MSVINQMLKDLEKRGRSSMHPEMALPDMPVTVFFSYKRMVNSEVVIKCIDEEHLLCRAKN